MLVLRRGLGFGRGASLRSGHSQYFLAGLHSRGFRLPLVAVCAGSYRTDFRRVFSLLAYALIKFRRRPDDDGREPPQIYGSNQVELAWTVIPVLIVVVLFLASARVIHAVEDAVFPAARRRSPAIGHQFWWEFQYPGQGFVTANELHVPVSDPNHPTPTHITLMSADMDHSFWVPKLAGKTDLIPNRVNKCGSIRTTPECTWANVRSTAGPSTPRCCYGWWWIRGKISTSGSPTRNSRLSNWIRLRKDATCLNPRRASIVTRLPAPTLMASSVPT